MADGGTYIHQPNHPEAFLEIHAPRYGLNRYLGIETPRDGEGDDINSLAGKIALASNSSVTTSTSETEISYMEGYVQQNHKEVDSMKYMLNSLM